jgi:hypothetical protein
MCVHLVDSDNLSGGYPTLAMCCTLRVPVQLYSYSEMGDPSTIPRTSWNSATSDRKFVCCGGNLGAFLNITVAETISPPVHSQIL